MARGDSKKESKGKKPKDKPKMEDTISAPYKSGGMVKAGIPKSKK